MRMSEFQPPDTWEQQEPADAPSPQDVMFAIFEYARCSDGIDSTVGPERIRQTERMFAKDRELRGMLDALQHHAYAEGRKDEREEVMGSLKPTAEVTYSDPLALHGRIKWFGEPAPMGALLYARSNT